jgi:general secretion pathway protein G
MVRNTVTGNKQETVGRKQKAEGTIRSAVERSRVLRTACCRLPTAFTLLELMIVITIIIILAAIVLPQYQKSILHTREAVLREDLFKMRILIDQFAADKQKLPQSLDELVTERYMREKPQDPMTGQPDWVETTGEDPNVSDGGQGLVEIHSASTDVSSDGTTRYNEW